MRAIDAVERLVCESEVSVAVLGRGRDFMLIRLDGDGELDPIELAEARSRGFFYAGALGITDGQPTVEWSDPDAALVMTYAAFAFAQEMAVAGLLRPKDDSARFLEELHRLPDTRPAGPPESFKPLPWTRKGAGGDPTPPPASQVCCPGEKAPGTATSSPHSGAGDGTERQGPKGGLEAAMFTNPGQKGPGVAHGYCPDTGLVDVPCIVRGDTMPNPKA